jgi:hypothetical protein
MKFSILALLALFSYAEGATINVNNAQVVTSTNANSCTPAQIKSLESSVKSFLESALDYEKKAKEFDNLFGPRQGDVYRRMADTMKQSARNAQASLIQCQAQGSGSTVNPPTTSSTIPSVQTTPAPLPSATSALNNIIQQQTNIPNVNTATTNTANRRTDIFSQGSRMFTCSSGFLEVCEGTNSSKCIWKTGNAQDLSQYQLGMEESAKRAEKSAQDFDKAFGAKAGDSFRQNAQSIRAKAQTCKVK